MPKKDVIVIGDFSVEQYYYGKIKKIAKDAPVPIAEVFKIDRLPGSASIISEKLKHFGINPIPIGIIGKDYSGKWLSDFFKKLKIVTKGMIFTSKGNTPIISRIIAEEQQVFRFDERNATNYQNYSKKILQNLKRFLETTNTVIIADYGFGTLNEKLSTEIIDACLKKRVNIFVSSTGYNYLMFKNPMIIHKINKENALLLIEKSNKSELSSAKICKNLEQILGCNKILLTKGKEGIAIHENGITIEMPAIESEKKDIKGIGEIMIAAIVMSLLRNDDFGEACSFGNIAASLAAINGNVKIISKRDILVAKREYEEWLEQK